MVNTTVRDYEKNGQYETHISFTENMDLTPDKLTRTLFHALHVTQISRYDELLTIYYSFNNYT